MTTNFKIFLLAFATAFLPLTALSQVQKGQVRTLARPDKKSQGLSGVLITVLESPNSVTSTSSGSFSFNLPGKKEGEQYTIARIQKNNYTLVDSEVKGRRYGFSTSVPLEIVMVSRQQLEEDKQRIEDKATERALRKYNQQKAELEQLRQEKRLTEELYAKRQRALNDNFDRFMSLVDRMAETYALTDCENITEINRQILEAIEAAELEKADSLIRSKGDYDQREQEIKLGEQVAKEQIAIGEEGLRQSKVKMADLAQDYYHQHTILTANYDFAQAAAFLERRARLDSTNIRWQMEAANFIYEFLVDYQRAQSLAQHALKEAIAQEGTECEMAAYCLNDLAKMEGSEGHFEEAITLMRQSVDLRRRIFGEQNEKTAHGYSNLAQLFREKDLLDSARIYYERALSIRQSMEDNACDGMIDSYFDLGKLERKEGHPRRALEYYQQALALIEDCKGKESVSMLELSNALGSVYTDLDSLDTALSWYLQALETTKKYYGEEHPNVATILNNIGTFYSNIRHSKEAYAYHSQALELMKKTLGEVHPDVGHAYGNLATALGNLDRTDEAYQYMQKALELDLLFYGEQSTPVALDYSNMATLLNSIKRHDEALELAQKSLDINSRIYGPQSNQVARSLGVIADIYYSKKDFTQSVRYNLQAIDFYKANNGNRHSSLVTILNNLAETYNAMGEIQKQLNCMETVLSISRETYGEGSVALAIPYSNLSYAYFKVDSLDKALEYAAQSRAIKAEYYGEQSPQMAQEYQYLAIIYKKMNNHTKAIDGYEASLNIMRSLKGDDSQEVLGAVNNLYLFYNDLPTETAAENRQRYKQFMADKSIALIPGPDGPAAAKGMKGEYRMLQYFNWTIDADSDTSTSFFSVHNQVREQPKHFVVMSPEGQVERYDFEEATIKVMFQLKYIDPATKQTLIQAWQEWKTEQTKE